MVMKVAVLPRIPALLRVLHLVPRRTPVPRLVLRQTLAPMANLVRVLSLAPVANLAMTRVVTLVPAPVAIQTLASFLIPTAVNSSTPAPGSHSNQIKEGSSIQVWVNSWTPARRTSSTAKGLNPSTPASSSSSIREEASSWMRSPFNFSTQTLVGL